MGKQEVSSQPLNLPEYLMAADRPFCWGEHDCVTYGDGWVANNSKSVISDQPKWHTKASAYRALRRVGGLEAALNSRLQPAIGYPMEGYITLIDGTTVGICYGPYTYFLSPNGIQYKVTIGAKFWPPYSKD